MVAQWPTPVKTWVHNEEPPATTWNQEVRDRFEYLKQNQDSLSGFFRGHVSRSHPDADKAASKIFLEQLRQGVVDSGHAVLDWTSAGPLVADLAAAGAGGLDQGVEQVSTWYEYHGIHRSSDGAKALLLHRAKDFFLDESYDAGDDASVEIRKTTGNRTAAGQGLIVDTTGKVEFIDLKVLRVGAVVGYIQAELRTDDGTGKPSATVLATSDVLDAANIDTNSMWIRFIFRSPATLTAATQYHIVLTGTWSQSDTVYIAWRCDTSASTYANGQRTQLEGGTWNATSTSDFMFKAYVTRNDTPVVMPTGYDGKLLLGYFYNKSDGNIRAFEALEKQHVPLLGEGFDGLTAGAGTVPTLAHMPSYLPPVPVMFTPWLRNGANSSWDIRIGGVPDGWWLPAGQRNSGQTREDGNLSGGITLSLGVRMEAIKTRYQGLYARAGAGTIDSLVASGWEWA